ncbi:MAG: acetaldehyde dehydrogenase (acetylating) [Actinomycetota bacterium]
MSSPKIRVAVLGTGNIGTDLCERLLLDDEFEVVAVVGRRTDSPGLQRFEGRIKNVISNGIEGLGSIVDDIDGAFDATSAYSHAEHWSYMKDNGTWMMDLTPSRIGTPVVPELLDEVSSMSLNNELVSNYSMVTCGGQSSAPLMHAMAKNSRGISEVEVSSSIASLSAGPATRRNIDQYIASTEDLVRILTGCSSVKSILVLNPAEPPVMMRTTVQMRVQNCNVEAAKENAAAIVKRVQKYVPGYDIAVEPYLKGSDLISATAKVVGAGYYLPPYAGNLDIINAAAVQTARLHARKFQ